MDVRALRSQARRYDAQADAVESALTVLRKIQNHHLSQAKGAGPVTAEWNAELAKLVGQSGKQLAEAFDVGGSGFAAVPDYLRGRYREGRER